MMRMLLQWWLRICRAQAAAQTRRELRAVSDRLLRDVGLERDQIDSLFR